MLRQATILFLIALEMFLHPSLHTAGNYLRILCILWGFGILAFYHTERLIMANDLRIDRIGSRPTERQIIDHIKDICLACTVRSDETIHLRRELQLGLSDVLIIQYRQLPKYHCERKGTKLFCFYLVFCSLICTFAPDLCPNNKKIIKIMAKNNVKAAPEAMEQQVTKTEAFFEKNKKAIIICVIAIIAIVVLAILAKNYYFEPRANEASTELAKSQDLFQQEQYDKALAGFQKVAADYSSTDAGNLAQLYIGLCQANLGKWQEAVNALESFSGKDDQMITPAAEGALGNAYANLNQLDKAVEHLKKAASMADNNSLSPTFLIQAGEILESQGKKDEALKLYQEVKEKYFNSMQYQTIDAYIERCK